MVEALLQSITDDPVRITPQPDQRLFLVEITYVLLSLSQRIIFCSCVLGEWYSALTPSRV